MKKIDVRFIEFGSSVKVAGKIIIKFINNQKAIFNLRADEKKTAPKLILILKIIFHYCYSIFYKPDTHSENQYELKKPPDPFYTPIYFF